MMKFRIEYVGQRPMILQTQIVDHFMMFLQKIPVIVWFIN